MCDLCSEIKTKEEFFNSVEYGKRKFGIVKEDENIKFVFYPEDDPYYSESIDISFCPKCGRKL